MTPGSAHQENGPAEKSPRKPEKKGGQIKKKISRKKTGPAEPVARPVCILIQGQGSCPEWEGLLAQYPMIDSVQREDFPEYGASFAYLAHFYRTVNTAEESSRAQQEFENFFQEIGYKYDYSGNYESRWFEGIGVRIG